MTAKAPIYARVELTFVRETKNTIRFDADVKGAVIPTLYVSKDAFLGSAPARVSVTVQAATK